jgi:hypothetical protein
MFRLLTVLVAALALVGASSALGADPSAELRILGYDAPLNLFSTTAGPLCPTGTMDTEFDRIVTTGVGGGAAFDLFGSHWNEQAWSNGPSSVVSGTTTFTCPDGTLTVQWHSVGDASDLTPPLEGRFTVTGGTGAYAALSGEGAVSWDSTPVGFFFTFVGAVRSN